MKTTATSPLKLTSGEISTLSCQIYRILEERRALAYKALRNSEEYKKRQNHFVNVAKDVCLMVKKSGLSLEDFCGRFIEHSNGKQKFSVPYTKSKFESSEWFMRQIRDFPVVLSAWEVEKAIKSCLLDIKLSGETISKNDLIDKIIEYL